jgi:lysophospholipase L1-like esterase
MGIMLGLNTAIDVRLQAVLQRLVAGQTVTVAAIGGSITTGYACNPPRERGWAAQVTAWLGQMGVVRYVNVGVSGTDSAAAVQRVKAHVLNAGADLVFVEFGVNDQWLDARVRGHSYEGLLRQLLSTPSAPAVVPLLLTQQANQARDAVELQQGLAAHYGLTSIDFGRWMQRRVDSGQARWETLYDEPIHPNQNGHDAIAQALIETLQLALKAVPAAHSKGVLPQPLFSRDYEFVRMFGGDDFLPWCNQGFERGGSVHAEWETLPGGQAQGWSSTEDGASASFLVWGRHIGLFHGQHESYRNLEAWVDDGPHVTVQGYGAQWTDFVAWLHTSIAIDLEPGAHLLHVRVKADEFSGSGRPAGFINAMAAGLLPPSMALLGFTPHQVENSSEARSGWQYLPAADWRLQYVGRSDDTVVPDARLLAWSGSELRLRFSGTGFALRMNSAKGSNYFTVEVDGRRHVLRVDEVTVRDWYFSESLPEGEHQLRIIKRTEASMAEACFFGLLLPPDGELLAPPSARPLRLEFYGDSITAGACNGDMGVDQYDDLSSHDGTRAYGALVAERLGADYVGIAVSGIGITRTWDELLMPQVWDRVAPRLDAPVAPIGPVLPDLVVVNLGQNDHGFPASLGEPFAVDFGQHYLSFVRQLRQRYPQAQLLLTLGGMPAWKEQPALLSAVKATAEQLRRDGDAQVWFYQFQIFSEAHPRIDVHAQMADELLSFLREKVLP